MSSPITEQEDICVRKCEDCSVKLCGDDEGDKCQDCLDQEEEEEQRCPCGLTLSDDDLALESGKCEGCTMQDKIVLVPSLEELTVEEQIKMCGETFDRRQIRHLAIGQMNICCLGCGEVLWNLRYDADKKISKLISGGLAGYVCGDDSNSACAPEDEDASEYGEETEDEDN